MRRIVVAAVVWGVMLIVVGSAVAAPASVTIDARKVDLAESEPDWTASVGLTNLTDSELSVDVPPVGKSKCDPSIDKEGKLANAEHGTFKVTIPAICEVGDGGTTFEVEVTGPGLATPVAFDVTATPKPAAEPEWEALRVFPIALGILALAAVLYLLIWVKRNVKTPLEYLGATWSFKDSWVSNVTIAAGLLTGIFGSTEVVKAVLGEDPDRAIALATVGAAIAAAMIGAGPLVLEATKVESKGKDYFSLGGLVTATVIGVAAAFGELWVVCRAGSALDLGGLEDWLWLFVVIGGLLLLLYAVTNLPRTIRVGITEPPPAEDSDAIKGAKMIVEQMKKGSRVQVADTALDESLREFTEAAAEASAEESAEVPPPPPPPPAAMP